MEELLPCPFCGTNDVEVFKDLSDIHDFQVLCNNCGAETRPQGFRYTKEEAIKDWNTRYNPGLSPAVKKYMKPNLDA